jgi:diguanylate cyclase (GGDEF)-like protein
MRSQEIHFTDLLKGVLPLNLLSPELQRRVQDALAAGEQAAAERVALDAIRELEGRGILRVEKLGERLRRYRNLSTGATITIHLPEEPEGTIATVPLPVLPGGAPASLETTRELLLLASRILPEDGSQVVEKEPMVQLLLSFTRQVLGCEEAVYLALEPASDDDFTHVSESDSPFASLLADDWGAARAQILTIRDRSSAGEEDGARRSGAAIRVGRPGDRVRGALEVWSSRPGHFTRERLAVLELIAEVGRELLNNVSRLQQLVFIDSRTQIFNKAFFEIQFQNILARARREGRQMALAIIDVDDFKKFNSRYGYAGGDQVLGRVAQTLKSQVRPFDCVARWGGEEFTIVLAPPVEHDDALAVCDRLRRAVQQTTLLIGGLDGKEHRASVTVSVGGALFPDDGSSVEELWSRANESLLIAKEQGKNRVHFRPHDRRDLRVAPA